MTATSDFLSMTRKEEDIGRSVDEMDDENEYISLSLSRSMRRNIMDSDGSGGSGDNRKFSEE